MRPPKRAAPPNVAPRNSPRDDVSRVVGEATRLPGLTAPLNPRQPPQMRLFAAAAPVHSGSPPQSKQARSHYEFAMGRAQRGDYAAAAEALQRAVKLDPAMATAWRKLGDMLIRAGDAKGADAAYMSYVGSAAGDADLMRAAGALLDGKCAVAERLLRARLRTAPSDVAAMRLLAETCVALGGAPEAALLLEQALALAPSFAAARHTYSIVLFRLDKAGLAIPHIERLLENDAQNAAYRTLLASCLATIGAYRRALMVYESLVAQFPNEPALWQSYARALRHAGRGADSAQAYRKAIFIDPDMGEAYLGLVDMTKGNLPSADLAAMQSILAKPELSAEARCYLHYALGQALERAGDYRQSFGHYAQGAGLRRAGLSYDAEATSAGVGRAIAVFTPAFFNAHSASGSADPSPIFIVGMPRAGSTLIEQILASHSEIEGTRELPEVIHIANDLGGGRAGAGGNAYPACLAGLDRAGIAAMAARYLERSRIYRTTDKPFFIDKMPANWLHAGLIHLMFPRAKIIDARRHPTASCFSAFRQCFGGAQEFTYDLTELGRYYNDYVRLMRHFDSVLPGRVHRVIYEHMVADTEAEIRRLLAYCDVAFEPACVRYWETNRAVTTASSEQVRQPIFRHGLDQWRHFEPWLGPLEAALQQATV